MVGWLRRGPWLKVLAGVFNEPTRKSFQTLDNIQWKHLHAEKQKCLFWGPSYCGAMLRQVIWFVRQGPSTTGSPFRHTWACSFLPWEVPIICTGSFNWSSHSWKNVCFSMHVIKATQQLSHTIPLKAFLGSDPLPREKLSGSKVWSTSFKFSINGLLISLCFSSPSR